MTDHRVSVIERASQIGYNIRLWKQRIENRITIIERYLMEHDDTVVARLKSLENRLAAIEQRQTTGETREHKDLPV